jgi:hypothetical protein
VCSPRRAKIPIIYPDLRLDYKVATHPGEEPARLALILTEQAKQESHGLSDFKTDLADLARIVELFNAEQNVDNLANLKGKKLWPTLNQIT